MWTAPDFKGLLLLFGNGALATMAQWAGVYALKQGDAAVVGNFEYMKLICTAILGYLLFEEIPDQYTVIGGAIIVFSTVYLVYREHRVKSRVRNSGGNPHAGSD